MHSHRHLRWVFMLGALSVPPVSTQAQLPFCDDFVGVSGTPPDSTRWISNGVIMDSLALGEWTMPLSAHFDGADTLSSPVLDFDIAQTVIGYYFERGGSGQAPDVGDDLILEFWVPEGGWIQVSRQYGDGTSASRFGFAWTHVDEYVSPDFRFRFRTTGQTGTGDWFVDSICLERRPCSDAEVAAWDFPPYVWAPEDTLLSFNIHAYAWCPYQPHPLAYVLFVEHPDYPAPWLSFEGGDMHTFSYPETATVKMYVNTTGMEPCSEGHARVYINPGDNGPNDFRDIYLFIEPCDHTPVSLTRLEATSVDEGVELTWSMQDPEGINGFNVLRAEGESGAFRRLNSKALEAGSVCSFVDGGVKPGGRYWYRIEGVNRVGATSILGQIRAVFEPPGSILSHLRVEPTPSRGEAAVLFDLRVESSVWIRLFDIHGQLVRTICAGDLLSPGSKAIRWDGRDEKGDRAGNGIYLVRVQTPELSRVVRLVKVR